MNPSAKEIRPGESFDQELFEERAAIREYDGGYSRPTAERLAREDVMRIAERKRGKAWSGEKILKKGLTSV